MGAKVDEVTWLQPILNLQIRRKTGRPRVISDERVMELRELEESMSRAEISRRFHIGRKTLTRYLGMK